MPQRARSRARPPGLRPCPGTRTGRPWGWRENATAAAHRPGPRPAYRGRRRPPPHHAALQARDTAWSAAAAPGLPNALPWHPEGDRQQRHWEHRLRFRARLRASRRHPWRRSVGLAARRSRDAFVQDHGRRDQRAWEHEPPEFHARYLHTGAVECGLLPLRHATRATGATRAIRADGLHGPATRPGTGAHRSEEHTSELQSPCNLVCRLLLEKKKKLTRGPDRSPERSDASSPSGPPSPFTRSCPPVRTGPSGSLAHPHATRPRPTILSRDSRC